MVSSNVVALVPKSLYLLSGMRIGVKKRGKGFIPQEIAIHLLPQLKCSRKELSTLSISSIHNEEFMLALHTSGIFKK